MQIEPILQEIEDAGLKVLNLFQIEDGIWQANLYDNEKAWTFGRGESPSVALSIALENTRTTKGINLTSEAVDALFDNLF